MYSGGKDCRSFGQGGQNAITAAERGLRPYRIMCLGQSGSVRLGWPGSVCLGQSTASARLEVAKVLTAKEVASQPSASQQDRPSSGALQVGIRKEVNWVIELVSTTSKYPVPST